MKFLPILSKCDSFYTCYNEICGPTALLEDMFALASSLRPFRKRFKCTVCKDYDLCAQCHAKRHSVHSGHDFRQMPSPTLMPRSCVEITVTCDGCGKKSVA